MARFHFLDLDAIFLNRSGIGDQRIIKIADTDRARSFCEPSVKTKTSHNRAPPEQIPSAKHHARHGKHVSIVDIRDHSLQSDSIHPSCDQSQCPTHDRGLRPLKLSLPALWTRCVFRRVRTMGLLDDNMLNIGFARHCHRVHRGSPGEGGRCKPNAIKGKQQQIHEGVLSGIHCWPGVGHLSQ